MGSTEEVVGGVVHEVDTVGAVEVGKPAGLDSKVSLTRAYHVWCVCVCVGVWVEGCGGSEGICVHGHV